MDASLASMLPRVFISMAIVVLVMWIAARVMKNRQIPGSGSLRLGTKNSPRPAVVQVLGRSGVGKNAAVTVVRAGDKTLVIGVTDQQVTLLAELPDARADAPGGELASVTDITDSNVFANGDQRTGLSKSTAGAPRIDQTWKELLEQVRERTVRRA